MSDERHPGPAAFLPASMMYFCSGQPMHFCCSVDTRNIAEIKFEPVPGMPTCAPGAVLSGDPSKGASIIVGKLPAGCLVPWHYHTPNEQLMMISGVARLDVKDGEPVILRAGGFALMPSHHVHQFRCTTACSLFVHSDAAYDIRYVDAEGKEFQLMTL